MHVTCLVVSVISEYVQNNQSSTELVLLANRFLFKMFLLSFERKAMKDSEIKTLV